MTQKGSTTVVQTRVEQDKGEQLETLAFLIGSNVADVAREALLAFLEVNPVSEEQLKKYREFRASGRSRASLLLRRPGRADAAPAGSDQGKDGGDGGILAPDLLAPVAFVPR